MAQLSLLDDAPAIPEMRIDPGDWHSAVRPPGRPQIVVGGPGTGKTQFLCERIAAAIEGGIPADRILVLGFSRDGVSDIRTRLDALVGAPASRITIATYHSLAMRVVEARASELGWTSPPSVLTGAEQERLVAEILADEDESRWPALYRTILTTDAMAAEVTDFLLRAAENGVAAPDLDAAGRDQWQAIPAFVARYESTLLERGRIDYGVALREAARTLENDPDLTDAFDLVVADEFQDTSPAQSRMVLAFARSTPDLVVAADPYQSIYSFRGTDINNVFLFPGAVERACGTVAQRLILTTSFRVPAEILDAAVAVTARELPGGAGRVSSTRSGGAVVCHEFGTHGEEADWIAQDIERIHLTEGIPLDRIAVFVRSHTPFVDDLARSLERRGIPHTHAEERLSNEPIIRFLHDLVASARGAEGADEAMRRVALGPYVGLPHGQVLGLPEEPESWPEWLRKAGDDLGPIAALVESDAWCTSSPAAAGLWTVWSTLPQLAPVALDDEWRDDRRAWSAYAQAVERIGQRSPNTTLAEHADLVARFDFEADPLFSVHDRVGVTLATLHRAKGTEFDAVYIANAIEGHLPDLRTRESLLGVRHLNPHLPEATADYVTFRLDEERRLAYTAMTRSTSRVVWTATVASETVSGAPPSRFMRLVAPTSQPAIIEEPLTARSFIASLRRTLSDPTATAVDRLAAMLILSDGDLIGGHPLDRYGVRARGSDAGIVPDELRLSPSQAVSFQKCPRRYAVERHVLTTIEESAHMLLGTLIHDVLERTESAAMEADRERGTIDEALVWLDDLWPESGFGADSVALAWKARAARILDNLYSLWPTSAAPVALELDLPLTIDGTSWLGRADRVERTGDGLTVVDYKTGNPMKVKDARQSLQLGYYALASAAHDELVDHGSIVGAEFWYPKDTNKESIVTRELDMANLGDLRDEMVRIAGGIRSEAFAPTPGDACRTCPVISTCPALESGAEAFTS